MTNQQRYTLDEAAGKVGVRADDLPAILPEINIDMSKPGHEGGTLSEEEFARLSKFVAEIKHLDTESPESGAD